MKLWKTVAATCLMAWSALAAAEPGVTDSSITLGMSAPSAAPTGPTVWKCARSSTPISPR